MANLLIHAGSLLKFDEETKTWAEWFFLLRPAVLEYHQVGEPLGDEPPQMPLATAWVGDRLYQPRQDHVVITLRFADPPTAPPEEWFVAAASRTEARQWVDALETLGVRRSTVSVDPAQLRPAGSVTSAMRSANGKSGDTSFKRTTPPLLAVCRENEPSSSGSSPTGGACTASSARRRRTGRR